MYWYVHKIRRYIDIDTEIHRYHSTYIDTYIYTHKIRPWALNLKSTLVLKVLRNSFIIIFVLTKSASGMVSLPTSRQAKVVHTVCCMLGGLNLYGVCPTSLVSTLYAFRKEDIWFFQGLGPSQQKHDSRFCLWTHFGGWQQICAFGSLYWKMILLST